MLRLKRVNLNISVLFFISLLITFNTGLAAQKKVVGTDKKPQEEISDNNKAEPDKKVEKGYIYDPTGKTDPFKSFIALREEMEAEKKSKPKTYLETLELSQLSLVVIIIGPNGKWAMVKDSKDVGHVIREGTPIGTNGGVVYKIREGEVVIREEYKDFRGRIQHKDIAKKTPSLR